MSHETGDSHHSHETGDSHLSAYHSQSDDQSFSGHHTPHSFADDFMHPPHWSHDSGHHGDEHTFLGALHPLSEEQPTYGHDDQAKDVHHAVQVSDIYTVEVKPEDYFGSQ
jgi:hypothetical protein